MTDLPAGPDLDRLIAEKVMGYEVRPNPDRADLWLCINPKSGRPYIFSPSTSIAHAWEVVRKMREDPDHMFVVVDLSDEAYAGRLHYRQQIFPSELTKAPTAELAICLAALKSLG